MQSENKDLELDKKIDEVYKEILSNNLYTIGCNNPRKLNKEDYKVFFQALNRLCELKEEYKQVFNNREVLGNKIADLASHLIILADYIQGQIRYDANRYKASNELFIKNFEKLIYIIFNAQSSLDFALKKIYASGIGSFEIKHGTRDAEQINGLVYIIGDATALAKLEDNKVYWESDIKKFASKMMDGEKSLIMAFNYCYDTNLLPSAKSNSYLKINGNGSIYCYLKDDIMKIIVNRLLSYAMENGNHIDDIPEKEILNNISINQKKLTKN